MTNENLHPLLAMVAVGWARPERIVVAFPPLMEKVMMELGECHRLRGHLHGRTDSSSNGC
jgi:hypothetical protein